MVLETVRWKQRFVSYKKAVRQLIIAVELKRQRQLSELETQGLIQSFEYCHELAWKVLKDFFTFQGINNNILGSRDAIREAFSCQLITNGDVWMQMITSRNQTSHTYDATMANIVADQITKLYYQQFIELQTTIQVLYDKDEALNFRFGLEAIVIEKIINVFVHHPAIEKAIIYGSRAKGNFRQHSDIDLTLVGQQLDSSQLATIERQIDNLSLPYKIDLSLYHLISNPQLIINIDNSGKTFYLLKS